MQQRRDSEILYLRLRETHLLADRRRQVGDPVRVPLLVPLAGLDVESEYLEGGEVRVLQICQARGALLRQATHHVTCEDQESRPRDEGQQGALAEPCFHPQPLEHLEEEHQCNDEHTGEHREPAPAEESRENDGQIIEAEERELLVDQVVDAEQRGDEQENEDPLEVLEEELLGALQRTRLSQMDLVARDVGERAGIKVGNGPASCKVSAVTPARARAVSDAP